MYFIGDDSLLKPQFSLPFTPDCFAATGFAGVLHWRLMKWEDTIECGQGCSTSSIGAGV